MTEHLTTSKMAIFCERALSDAELATVARHLAKCSGCQQQLVATLRRQRGAATLSFTLAPEFWLRHEHIDYEQLVELAENTSDPSERESVDVHLKVCLPCQEDVRSFLAFREQIAPEMKVSYAPVVLKSAREKFSWLSWWRDLAWKPIYAAAVVVIGIALVIGAALLLNRRAEKQQAQQVPSPHVSPVSTPDNRAANVLSPPPTPNESPIEKPNSTETIAVLNDRGVTITFDKNGNLAGLDDVPAPTRDQVAKVLLSERLERPGILKELGGQEGNLRGNKNTSPFRLTSPLRTVILSDRPTLKWEKASGATSYRVYVNNPAGHDVARSEELPAERTEWILPNPLKRGEIYVWTVMAIVDGKEIVSPDPTAPEMKFQVLPLRRLQQLNKVKKTRSHLVLGIFYANMGMVDEAEREFHQLVRLNPKSEVAKKLLRAAQSLSRIAR